MNRLYLFAMLPLMAACATTPPPQPPVVIVKHDLAPMPKPVEPPDPYASLRSDVAAAIRNHTNTIIHDGITTIWPYSPDQQWTVNCQPLRATEIRLADDEQTDKNNVMIGDWTRWQVRVGNGTVLVEPLGDDTSTTIPGPQPQFIPADPNMNTNLVIHTTKRSYHLVLRIQKRAVMPAVAWYYPDDIRQANQLRQTFLKQHQGDKS